MNKTNIEQNKQVIKTNISKTNMKQNKRESKQT